MQVANGECGEVRQGEVRRGVARGRRLATSPTVRLINGVVRANLTTDVRIVYELICARATFGPCRSRVTELQSVSNHDASHYPATTTITQKRNGRK